MEKRPRIIRPLFSTDKVNPLPNVENPIITQKTACKAHSYGLPKITTQGDFHVMVTACTKCGHVHQTKSPIRK